MTAHASSTILACDCVPLGMLSTPSLVMHGCPQHGFSPVFWILKARSGKEKLSSHPSINEDTEDLKETSHRPQERSTETDPGQCTPLGMWQSLPDKPSCPYSALLSCSPGLTDHSTYPWPRVSSFPRRPFLDDQLLRYPFPQFLTTDGAAGPSKCRCEKSDQIHSVQLVGKS